MVISWPAEKLLASQERLFSADSVSELRLVDGCAHAVPIPCPCRAQFDSSHAVPLLAECTWPTGISDGNRRETSASGFLSDLVFFIPDCVGICLSSHLPLRPCYWFAIRQSVCLSVPLTLLAARPLYSLCCYGWGRERQRAVTCTGEDIRVCKAPAFTVISGWSLEGCSPRNGISRNCMYYLCCFTPVLAP